MCKTQIAYGFRLWSDGDKKYAAMDTKLLKIDNRKSYSKIRQLSLVRSFFPIFFFSFFRSSHESSSLLFVSLILPIDVDGEVV